MLDNLLTLILQEQYHQSENLMQCKPSFLQVRLTFKDELQQLWISSATTTQKVPINTITKIEGSPIEGKEEYSIVALHLGSGSDKYWLYYFPSQHVASLKIRILGVESLL